MSILRIDYLEKNGRAIRLGRGHATVAQDGTPLFMSPSNNGTFVRRLGAEPLSAVASSALDSLDELPKDLSPVQKSMLGMNLLGIQWPASSGKSSRLSWALPFVDHRVLDRLNEENLSEFSTLVGGLIESPRRVALAFLAEVGSAIGEGTEFNDIVFRWLSIFKSDPTRAIDLARSLQGRCPDLAKGSEKELSPLEMFLRGDHPLEPLRVEEEIDDNEGNGGRNTVRSVPLSALAGIRSNTNLLAQNGRSLSVADVAAALRRGIIPKNGYPQTENSIERAKGADAGYEWEREGVQNGIKASQAIGISPRVGMRTGLRQLKDRTQLIASLRDRGVGMNPFNILNDLLPLDRSSFTEGQDPSLGFNGRGWYKFLVRSDRVRIQTGVRGDDHHTVLEVYKERGRDGSSRWMVHQFAEHLGAFEGTQVDWIQEKPGDVEHNRFGMELEAALIADSLETFAGALSSRGVELIHNGRSVAEKVTAVSEVSWRGDEKIRVVETSSRKRRVLHGGFFVTDLDQDPDLWVLVPEELRQFMRDRRFSLDLPVSSVRHSESVVLDRDRSGLAEKEKYLEHLQKAVLAAVTQAAAKALVDGQWRPKELPADYVYRPDHLWENNHELRHLPQEMAGNLVADGWRALDPLQVAAVFGAENRDSALAHFIAAVPVPFEGRMVSLSQLRVELQLRAKSPQGVTHDDIDPKSLPPGLAQMAAEAAGEYSALLAATRESDKWKWEDPASLPPDQREPKAALAALISGLMKPLAQARQAAVPGTFLTALRGRLANASSYSYDSQQPYKVSFGNTEFGRTAIFGKNWISLESGGAGRWLDWISRAQHGETTPQEDYEVLSEILETVAHEDAHAWEPDTEETHNQAFIERMRSSLIELAVLQMSPEQVFREVAKRPRTP